MILLFVTLYIKRTDFILMYIKRTDFILNKFLLKYYLPYSLMCAVPHITFPAGPGSYTKAP
jgi:hypothetical protein